MSRLGQGYSGDAVADALKPVILPIEETQTINGVEKKVPVKYIAEITKATEMTSKKGGGMLKLQLGIYYGEKRVYLDDFLSYNQAALFRIGGLMNLIGIDPKTADTDDFLGKFVQMTITHEEYTPEGATEPETRNRVARYVSVPTPEEIKAVAGETGDGAAPF